MKIKEIIRRNKERQRNEIISEYPCVDYLHNALHFLKSGKPEVAYSEICHAIIRSGAELSVEEKEEFKRVKASSNQTNPKANSWEGFERMSEELKECPFCGWGTIVDGGALLSHACQCNSCGAKTKNYKTWEDAVKAWNRREADEQ